MAGSLRRARDLRQFLACRRRSGCARPASVSESKGKGVAKVLSGFADNADCYLTATDGSIDDTDVAGDYINRMKGASAIDTPSTGLAEVELARPSVSDGKDN